jgi:hypothetical protein
MEEVQNKKKTISTGKIIAYLTFVFLFFVAFSFGGSKFVSVYSMLGFIFAVGVLSLRNEKPQKAEMLHLLYYGIPLIIFAILDSFSRFWTSLGASAASDLINLFGLLSAFAFGYGVRGNKEVKLKWILVSILAGLALLVLISTIYSLSRYGFFYIETLKGKIYFFQGETFAYAHEMKMLIGFNFETVTLAYGSIFAYILAASLCALLFIDPKKEKVLFFVVLGCGLVGLFSLVSFPATKAILLLVVPLVLACLLRLLPLQKLPSKGEKATFFSLLAIVGVYFFVVFVNAVNSPSILETNKIVGKIFNNGAYLRPINEIINAVLTKPFAGFNAAGFFFGLQTSVDGQALEYSTFMGDVLYLPSFGNRVFEFAALYEGGFFAFLGLCVFLAFSIASVRKFLYFDGPINGEKGLLALLLVAILVYLSFESSVFPYVYSTTSYVSPFRKSSVVLIALFLLGYAYTPIFGKETIVAPAADPKEVLNNEAK